VENDPHPEVYDHILVRQRGIKTWIMFWHWLCSCCLPFNSA